jgi:hypothetical protein
LTRRIAILAGGLWRAAAMAYADVERVEVKSRQDVLGGRSFGAASVSEAIAGTVHIVVNRANPHDRITPDLDGAPRDVSGRVHASAEIGDGFLLSRDDTVLWVGWQADLPAGRRTLRADLPRALGIDGMMRGDFTLARDAADAPIPGADLNPPLEREGAADGLLVRDDPYSPATPVSRTRWRFSEDLRRVVADEGYLEKITAAAEHWAWRQAATSSTAGVR